MRKINLDDILLSPETVAGVAGDCKASRNGCNPATIPDEQAGILRNGSLKIYVAVDGVEVSMIVPSEQWQLKN